MLLRFLLRVLFPTFRMRLDDIHSPRPSVLTSLPDLWLGYTESGTKNTCMQNSCVRWNFVVGFIWICCLYILGLTSFYRIVIFLPFYRWRSSGFLISLIQMINSWIFDLIFKGTGWSTSYTSDLPRKKNRYSV